jgi:hypothetical protein
MALRIPKPSGMTDGKAKFNLPVSLSGMEKRLQGFVEWTEFALLALGKIVGLGAKE